MIGSSSFVLCALCRWAIECRRVAAGMAAIQEASRTRDALLCEEAKERQLVTHARPFSCLYSVDEIFLLIFGDWRLSLLSLLLLVFCHVVS